MFRTIVAFVYLIPNIYVFLRIMQLFINKGYRVYYTLIYFVLFLLYPISNYISHETSGNPGVLVTLIADYLLSFYLYVFLFLLFFDLFLLINLIFRIIKAEKPKQTDFKTYVLSSMILLSILIVLYGIWNFNTIQISEYQISIPRKSSKIDHLKIAFVADFHLKEDTPVNFVKDFINKIEQINPDLMLFGGDIVEGNRNDRSLAPLEKLIKEIHTTYGVYAVLGNHEHYSGRERGAFFANAGITVLTDTSVLINHSFNLLGRNDGHLTGRENIEKLIKATNDSFPLFVMDHRPTEIDAVSKTAVDLQMSGHTHNGQLFPINLILNKMYRLTWGYEKIGNTHFFVTSGIRLWGPPVRTIGKSEIMVINVQFY